MSEEYRPVWLTWNLVPTTKVATMRDAIPSVAPRPSSELRYRVQMARVERRWSVADLATRVKCHTETLAAFERGDEVLHQDLQHRVRTCLEL